jgi:hypothetical protein
MKADTGSDIASAATPSSVDEVIPVCRRASANSPAGTRKLICSVFPPSSKPASRALSTEVLATLLATGSRFAFGGLVSTIVPVFAADDEVVAFLRRVAMLSPSGMCVKYRYLAHKTTEAECFVGRQIQMRRHREERSPFDKRSGSKSISLQAASPLTAP